MERKSLEADVIDCASWGNFEDGLKNYYKHKNELVQNYGSDPRITGLIRIDVKIALILYLRGEFEEAFELFTQTLEKMEKCSKEYTDEIFESKCYLATLHSRKMQKDLAGKIYDELRQHIGSLPVGCHETIRLKKILAKSLRLSGDHQSALEIFVEVYQSRIIAYGETASITEYSYADVGIVLLEQGKYREALSILEKVHNRVQLESFDYISYLRSKRYLADAHMYLGLVKIAEDLYRCLMEQMKDKYPNHPEVLAAMHNWGRSLAQINKPNDALEVLKEVHRVRCKQSPKHPDTARIALDIANIYLNKKEYINALVNFVDVPAQISGTFYLNPDLLIHSVTSIASIFDASQDASVKEQLFKAHQHVFQKQFEMRGLSDHHKEVLETKTRMGELLISLQKPGEALEVLKDVLEKRTLVLKNDYIDCVDVMKNIANACLILQNYVEAFEYYSEVYEIQKLITGDNSMETVKWESKVLEITTVKEKTVLIDAVVSNYRISIKGTTDSDNNVDMEDNNFPLHVASESGRIAMVKFLLFKGAIYNEENSEGKMPADVACNNAIKNFFSLIDSLFIAVKKVDHENIDSILDIMNDTTLRQDAIKGFPILLTGLDRIRDIVDKTILNARDESGSTTLHLACSNGDLKTVQKLLALEVDSTLTDKNNRSPRDVAEDKNFDEILQLLNSYVLQKSKDFDSQISQNNPEMSEDIMDQ